MIVFDTHGGDMRLLHTSDWHLGQEFYRHDRSFEHAQFLQWLKTTIVEQRVDVLLIAGDLYDTSNPPAGAQRMFYNFVREVKALAKNLVIIAVAGNHDSPSRFVIPAEIFETFSTHVVGRVVSTPEGLSASENFLIPLWIKDEPSPSAVCVALPFLRAADLFWSGETFAYPSAVIRAYQQSLELARRTYGSHIPLIGLGHMHAIGGMVSEESERKLLIGGEEAVALGSIAHEFTYMALGHLHLPQEVGGMRHVRYSGSPLPMGFSEINYPHQVLLIDIYGKTSVNIESIKVPRSIELLRCPKEPANLDEVINALRRLEIRPCENDRRPFLEIPVHVDGPTPELRMRIDEVLKDIPARLGRIVVSRKQQIEQDTIQAAPMGLENLRSIDPFVVLKKIHERDYGTEPSADLNRIFAEVVRNVSCDDGDL